jgi:hypothetical protein
MVNNMDLSPEELAEMETVAAVPDNRDTSKYIPFLKIMHKPVVEGKTVIAQQGAYCIQISKTKQIYLDHLTGVILAQRYRFVQRMKGGKLLATTTFENSPSGEFVDTLGTTRCGKRYAEEGAALSEEDKAYNKTINYECYLYMSVSGTGTDNKGEEVTVDNMLVQFSRSGGNAIEANNFVNALVRDRQHQVYEWTVELPETFKPEDSAYYNMELKKLKERTVTRNDLEYVRHVKSLVDDHNRWVQKKHEAAVSGKSKDTDLSEDFDEAVNE